MGINSTFKISTTSQEAMRHFPFKIFFSFFFFWSGLLGFEVEFLAFVKQNTWRGRRGKVIVNLGLGLADWGSDNSPSSRLHHLGPAVLPVQDLPKGKTKLK